jgi:lysophospholipase L1-like esterase
VFVVLAATTPAAAAPSFRDDAWETAWATAPAAAVAGVEQGYAGYTIRNVVHPTAGGDRVRIHLSNRFGTAPVLFGHVTVALAAGHPSDGTAAELPDDVLFDGRNQFTVPAGADAVSDPVALLVPPDRDLLVTTWTPSPSGTVTYHPAARQTSVLSRGPEDHAGDLSADAFAESTTAWHYLSAVDVTGPPGTVVALGDSITDGVASTAGANRRWTDCLADRLSRSREPSYAVANSGISGNRVLLDGGYPNYTIYATSGRSAQWRLPQDVFDRAGVRSVIVFEGVNDIQQAPPQPDPQRIIAGLAQIAARARAHGLRVIVATIMPFEGRHTWTPAMEAVRLAVNDWIRRSFPAVADFDAATRDPADPARLAPAYDSGDHLHPNDAGDLAMADAVPLGRL